jgi:hypothetical protein
MRFPSNSLLKLLAVHVNSENSCDIDRISTPLVLFHFLETSPHLRSLMAKIVFSPTLYS